MHTLKMTITQIVGLVIALTRGKKKVIRVEDVITELRQSYIHNHTIKRAYKRGDVVKLHSGKTIVVMDTHPELKVAPYRFSTLLKYFGGEIHNLYRGLFLKDDRPLQGFDSTARIYPGISLYMSIPWPVVRFPK